MKAFVHYKNKKVYVKRTGRTMIQEGGVWVPAVLYTTLEHSDLNFVRSEAEFNEKFMEIQLPDTAIPRAFDPSNL
jgi:hypothetical protein